MMIIILTFIILIIDTISKIIVSHHLYINQSISIINDFLSITYVKNTGAAWSIFDDKSIIVTVFSAIIIFTIIMYINKNKPTFLSEKIAYSFILGGAMGNFVNRVFYGYVIDFIDIKIFNYNYPIFNLADIFIVVGVILLVIFTWRCKKWR